MTLQLLLAIESLLLVAIDVDLCHVARERNRLREDLRLANRVAELQQLDLDFLAGELRDRRKRDEARKGN